ncbi:MAG: hypothetical protein CHACPFDD_02014 [Phycisphaerae bacterium]|nr:hypothetical protein [Phycisphaerae bacterium]
MPLSQADRQHIAAFREALERRYGGDGRVQGVSRQDRGDESTLASRFAVGEKLWLEVALRPFVPQIRVGIMTDDRWLSEDLEQVIEDSGDEMSEFVEAGFEEAGLTWRAPQVEHYRDQGKYFYFATPLEIASLAELSDAAVSEKVGRMVEGYYEAFKAGIRKATAS